MVSVKIKKDIENIYKEYDESGLKKLDAETFKGLEEIMAKHQDLEIVEHDYKDNNTWGDYTGQLVYRDYHGQKEATRDSGWYGELGIKFFAGNYVDGKHYTRIKIKSWGDNEKFTKIVDELTTKFKSFEK